jgi:hypothetical protein
MGIPLGDYPTSATVQFKWSTQAMGGESITRSTDGTLRIYKGGSTTERTSLAGVTQTEDFDSTTGVHHVTIDLSDNTDAGFYAAGSEYQVVMAGMVIDTKTVNAVLAHFSIERAGGVLALLKTIISGTGVNVTQLAGVTQSLTDLKDFADDGYDPGTNKVQGVVLTDTVTTYTGNTPQTGDSFARIGATGSGLTTLATAANLATAAAFIDTEVASILTAVDTEVAAIKAVTDLLPNGGALSSLATAAALTTLQGFVDTEVAAILAAVDTEVAAIKAVTDLLPNAGALSSLATAASIAALNNVSTANLASAIETALAASRTELGGVPAASASLVAKIEWLFMMLANPMAQTATLQTLRNRADSADVATAVAADDGTTTTRGAFT